MTKVDLDKTRIAITYVTRMAEGKNPVNNRQPLTGELLDNPHLIRCMFFIKDVLEEVRAQNGMIGVEKRSNTEPAQAKPFPFEVLEKFRYREDQSITHVLDQFKALARDSAVKPINYRPVIAWLKQMGYLQDAVKEDGLRVTQPTDMGQKLGLYLEHRKSFRGEEYDVVMYNQAAQEFLAKYLEAIVKGEEVHLSENSLPEKETDLLETDLPEKKTDLSETTESDAADEIAPFDPTEETNEKEEKTVTSEDMVAETVE